jgi:hypothetical protein
MPATNYARNAKTLDMLFINEATGEVPALQHLQEPWVWWRAPYGNHSVRLIGETPADYCDRLGHRPKACPKCKGIAPRRAA